MAGYGFAAVRHVTSWLAAEHATTEVAEECLDALETSLAVVPSSVLTATPGKGAVSLGHDLVGFVATDPYSIQYHDWRNGLMSHPWQRLLHGLLHRQPALSRRRRSAAGTG